jgi:hypothetical protein
MLAQAAVYEANGFLSIRILSETTTIPFQGTLEAASPGGGQLTALTIPASLVSGVGTSTGTAVFMSAQNAGGNFAVTGNGWIIGSMGLLGSINVGGISIPLTGIGNNGIHTGTVGGLAYTLYGAIYGAAAKATTTPSSEPKKKHGPFSDKNAWITISTLSGAVIDLLVESTPNVREGPLGNTASTLLPGGKLQLTSPFVLVGALVGPGYIIGNTTFEMNFPSAVPATTHAGLALMLIFWLGAAYVILSRRKHRNLALHE